MLALILYFTLSHIFSFICSVFEAVMLSCTPAYVDLLKRRHDRVGDVLGELKEQIDRPLAAILTLNTIAHTFGAAGVGASVVEVFGDRWVALASVILTLTMLYWTEMFPKTIGALYWKELAPFCAYPIRWLIWITYPFVTSFNYFGRMLARRRGKEHVTEEEILCALESGRQSGTIEEAEQTMVENIFRLGDRHVGMLMIPRVDIDWLKVDAAPETLRKALLASPHQYFPVCHDDIDRILGVVKAREVLGHLVEGKPIDLQALAKPPVFINETQQVFELMELFHEKESRLALVTDEYGSIQGMVTLSDIQNAILKDLEQEIVKVGTRTWLLEGTLPIDEFKQTFHLESLPSEERARYRTLSGLCMTQLGEVPKKGDVFIIGSLRFEVLKVRNRRVEKILLTSEEPLTP